MADEENKIEAVESQLPVLGAASESELLEEDDQWESQHLAEASGSAFAAARAQVLASGQSVLQSEQGFIYEVFPDGRRVRVKQTEPPTPVQAGRKITIR
jgi:hypothetical protein